MYKKIAGVAMGVLCFAWALGAHALTISEIMYNPVGSDTGHEWIEVYNDATNSLDLTNATLVIGARAHKITSVQGSARIAPGDFAIVAAHAATFLQDNPTYGGALFHASFSLKNSGDTIALKTPQGMVGPLSYASTMGGESDGNSLNWIGADVVSRAPSPGMSVSEVSLSAPASSTTKPSAKKSGSTKKRAAAVVQEVGVNEKVVEVATHTQQLQTASVGGFPSTQSVLAFFGIIALAITGVLAARQYAAREWSIVEEDS